MSVDVCHETENCIVIYTVFHVLGMKSIRNSRRRRRQTLVELLQVFDETIGVENSSVFFFFFFLIILKLLSCFPIKNLQQGEKVLILKI